MTVSVDMKDVYMVCMNHLNAITHAVSAGAAVTVYRMCRVTLASGLCSSSAHSAVAVQQLCTLCVHVDHSATYVWAQQSTGTGNVATPNISQRQIQRGAGPMALMLWLDWVT
jgi:hypothetical protein